MVINYVLRGQFLSQKFLVRNNNYKIQYIIIISRFSGNKTYNTISEIQSPFHRPLLSLHGFRRLKPLFAALVLKRNSEFGACRYIYFQDPEQDPGKSRVCFTTMM